MQISKFGVKDTAFEGVKIIQMMYAEDTRGYFQKSMEREVFQSFGLDADFMEEFSSFSRKDVIRGMHFQLKFPQAKMVQAVVGTIYDVIVDLRENSTTFGSWFGIGLSDKLHECLWIPAGFAHGYRVLSEQAIVSYQCVGKYYEEYDSGIRWNDPDVGINWNLEEPLMSERDKNLQSYKDFLEKYHYLSD